MHFLTKKPFIILGLFVLGLIVLPVTVFFIQQRQQTQSQADKTVILSFEPSSTQAAPLQIPAGSTFTLDVFVEPGASSVSYIKAEMLYDAARFELAGGFIPNREVFSQVVESPTPTAGKVVTTLSIGSDLSKAVTSKTKVGTLALRALSNVPANGTSSVSFGPGSQALAVSSNSSFNENVIASTVPATVRFNTPALTCGTSPTDVMLVIDKSGSMEDPAGTSGSKLANAKIAANNFVDILAKEPRNTTGLSTFASTGTLNSPLTNNFASVKSQITAITSTGGTCIECGIIKANQDIATKKRQGIKNVVVLLTDGRANYIEGNGQTVSEATAEQRALAAAANGHTANSTIYFTIGLGADVDSAFLTNLAESTGGQYYFSPTSDQLNGIYKQISEILAKGSVTGSVFNDTNGNGQLDTSEQGMSGWLMQLYSSAAVPQTITTDSTGSYTFTNLCDGSYTVRQVMQSGWKQTYPVTPKDYAVNITNGNAATDKIFGNNKGSRCSDGIDNDGNGFIDAKDSTCHTDGNPDNPSSYDPNKDGERGSNTCSDSKDNNGNGKKDGADPICHVDGDITKPYDPDLPEGTTDTSLVCTPNTIALNDGGKELSVTLKTEAGAPVANRDVVWSTSNNKIALSPLTTKTDNTGKAVSSALVSMNVSESFNASISAKFAGDTTNSSSACVIMVNYVPQVAPATLSLNVLLHGIGNSGDNANPTANSLSNKNPLTKERKAVVSLFDVSNNLVATAEGQIVYSSASGSFKGDVTTSKPVPPGKYSIKVRTDYHLTRLVPGIQTLVAGQKNTLPNVEAVAGDATNNNQLDIRDYNMLLDCYSDISAAIACNDAKKTATDANDDGSVNQFDYNLFLREISTQPGE
jgi:Mg-chelatase subunit ChlD